MNSIDTINNLLKVNVIISHRNGKPIIELRSASSDPQVIKTVFSAAYHNLPIVIMPNFTDRIKSRNSAIEKGILYTDTDENGKTEFYFTF